MPMSQSFNRTSQREDLLARTRNEFVLALNSSTLRAGGKRPTWDADKFGELICPTPARETYLRTFVESSAAASQVLDSMQSAGLLNSDDEGGTIKITDKGGSWRLEIPVSRVVDRQLMAHIDPQERESFKHRFPQYNRSEKGYLMAGG